MVLDDDRSQAAMMTILASAGYDAVAGPTEYTYDGTNPALVDFAVVVLPDGVVGSKPYSLLHKGMVDANVCAIAQVVISGREQLVLLRPMEDMLVMSVLSYSKRIKALGEFTSELEEQEMTDEEKALTSTLISASFLEDFDLKKYKDEHNENLSRLIQLKVDGKEIVEATEHEEPKIINLMDALKRSVAEAQAAGKKMAPSVGKKKAAKKKKSG